MKKAILPILISVAVVAAIVLAIAFIPAALEDKHLTVGVVNTSSLISYTHDGTQWDGVNCEIINTIAQKAGYTVEFKEIIWTDRDKLLKDEEIDCYIGSDAMLGDKNIATDTFLYSVQNVVYKEALSEMGIDSQTIKNFSCAVQGGSFNHNYLLSLECEKIKEYNSVPDILTAIKNDTCDIGIIDYGIYLSLVRDNPEYEGILSGILTDNQDNRLIFSEDDDKRVEKLNKAISKLVADKTLSETVKKYDIEQQQVISIY